MDSKERDRLQLTAAWSRVVLGLVAIVMLPLAYPGFEAHRWLLALYVAAALVGQLMIWRGVGGNLRSFLGGVLDMTVLTFMVHRTGSLSTMLLSIYFFAVILNTLTVGRRVGVGLALLAALLYACTVLAELEGVIPYGADAPEWAQGAPSRAAAFVHVSLVSVLLVASAAIVGLLVTRNRQREKQLRDLATRLEELSSRDPLTQLYNRRHLMARLEEELARVRRGRPLAVLMVDLDKFKRVNDAQGHQRGDEVLVAIADALSGTTREVDVPGRYGGDEFVVLLPDTPRGAAELAGERLVSAVRSVGLTVDEHEPVTASVGLSHARPGDGARQLIQRADALAYRAKEAGGDRLESEEPVPEWDANDESGVRETG